jgi:hypothetical protein
MRLTRQEIIDKLIQWRNSNLTRDQLIEWANDRYVPGSVDFDDWEGEEANSVSNEVLSCLSMMDIDDYSEDDIPSFLEFLKTPSGQFETGYRRFKETGA